GDHAVGAGLAAAAATTVGGVVAVAVVAAAGGGERRHGQEKGEESKVFHHVPHVTVRSVWLARPPVQYVRPSPRVAVRPRLIVLIVSSPCLKSWVSKRRFWSLSLSAQRSFGR